MRSGRPSRTSSLVTFLRAVADGGVSGVADFHDPTALALLSGPWRGLARLTTTAARLGPLRWAMRVMAGANGDSVPLRTQALDAAWRAAHAAGVRQLVLLGAGLDGRAYRLDDLADVDVWEVDHPATQAFKERQAAGLVARARRHVLVPVDFERDGLDAALAGAGHRADEPTCWIWEGVTPYLTPGAQRATLDRVAARSAPGSRLLATYFPAPETPAARAVLAGLRLAGEPFLGLLSPEAARALLEDAGFSVREDTGASDWRDRWARDDARDGKALLEERLVTGVR